MSIEAEFEELRAQVSKERAKTECMKKELKEMEVKVEEEKSERARMLEKKRLAMEEKATLDVYYRVLLAFLCGGNGGA